MKRLVELVDQPLAWSQPGALKMEYELRAGDQVAATLRFRSVFGSFATGESADGCWTFKRVGFWQPRATIRERDGEAELAIFKNHTWKGGGTLELPDGRRMLATTNVWQTKVEFQDEPTGAPLIRFKSRGVIHLGADVEIEPGAFKVPEMRWIVLFGWYLVILIHMDSGAAAAAAAG